jgi:nitroimidazol reductase NimA-like FMN-containing flavoprotein (pyridoxamine 5'-phosphate oxidase superfamily)
MTDAVPQANTRSVPAKPASIRLDDEITRAGQHRSMRRADREVFDPAQVREILDACDIVRIAYQDAEGLSIVPVNFGYAYVPQPSAAPASDAASDSASEPASDSTPAQAGLTLFMHSALHGRKIDAIRAAGNALDVAFEMECDCELIEGRTACNWSESFTSIIGTGKASVVEDPARAGEALAALMGKQAHMPNIHFTERQLATVTVWQVEADYFTAKHHPKPAPRHHM